MTDHLLFLFRTLYSKARNLGHRIDELLDALKIHHLPDNFFVELGSCLPLLLGFYLLHSNRLYPPKRPAVECQSFLEFEGNEDQRVNLVDTAQLQFSLQRELCLFASLLRHLFELVLKSAERTVIASFLPSLPY